MNKRTISIAVIATSAALVTATASATPPVEGAGNVAVQTAVKGGFALGSNGTSTSYAHNSESATASITATRAYIPGQSQAAVQGATKTDSVGSAYNVSTGSGSGSALSSGSAVTSTKGMIGSYPGLNGFNGGGSGTQTSNIIKAATNQGSAVSGQTVSGFDVAVNLGQSASTSPPPAGHTGGGRSASVEVAGATGGYASGANSTATLANMNAAGIANIQSSGYFFGKTNLSGSTGPVSAP